MPERHLAEFHPCPATQSNHRENPSYTAQPECREQAVLYMQAAEHTCAAHSLRRLRPTQAWECSAIMLEFRWTALEATSADRESKTRASRSFTSRTKQ